MPVPKPSQTADWANSAAGADMTPPSAGKQAAGWTGGESPAHNFFNWWQNLVGQWTDYANDLANQVWTWTARHTFNVGFDANATGGGNSAVHGTGSSGALAGKFDGGAVNANAGLAVSGAALTSANGATLSGGVTVNGGETVNGGLTVDTLNVPAPSRSALSASGWTSSTNWPKLYAWKDALGNVRVEGFLNTGGAAVSSVALNTVPAALRPANVQVAIPCTLVPASGQVFAGLMEIDTAGNCSVLNFGTATFTGFYINASFDPNMPHGP